MQSPPNNDHSPVRRAFRRSGGLPLHVLLVDDHPAVAGADGLLSKQALGEELCTTIRVLARGRRHVPAIPATLAPNVGRRGRERPWHAPLDYGRARRRRSHVT